MLQSNCGSPYPQNNFIAKIQTSNGSIDWITQTTQNTHSMWTPVLSVGGEQIQIYTPQSSGFIQLIMEHLL